MGKRIYPLKRIKYWWCYEVAELSRLYGVHVQTVREWIDNDLPTIDNGKPALIYGYELHKFLGKLNQSNRCKTTFEQMFCLKCRDAKKPYKRRIKIEQDDQSIAAKALCNKCKTRMNKPYKLDDLKRIRAFFTVVEVLELYDSATSPVNLHIQAQPQTLLSEPSQGDLFS